MELKANKSNCLRRSCWSVKKYSYI